MGKEMRRKDIDRCQQEIEVSVDRPKETEPRSKESRSGFERRIQQLKVSKDRRTGDRRRSWV